MKFGYTIIYVSDVNNSLSFFEEAFGLTRKFVHESGLYGELETGETTLAFAAHSLGSTNLGGGYIAGDKTDQPLGIEIALVTHSVDQDHQRAIEAGASELQKPTSKPWGQVVSYLRCPDGTLVELCTPVQ